MIVGFGRRKPEPGEQIHYAGARPCMSGQRAVDRGHLFRGGLVLSNAADDVDCPNCQAMIRAGVGLAHWAHKPGKEHE